MKRIEFIAPVEAIRGNLSGAQKLRYPTDDQGAYEGPVGSVNYARNYSPRFVGAKVAKSGLKYFSVRTKTANHLTAKSKKAMALLGGCGAIYAALIKTPALKANADAVFVKAQEFGDKRTYREFWMSYIRRMVSANMPDIHVVVSGAEITIDNPWGKFDDTLNINIAQEVRVKFWTELVANGIVFTVDGMPGVAANGEGFDAIIASNYNVLSLTSQVVSGTEYVKLGSAFLKDENNSYMETADPATSNAKYTTTDETPA